MAKTIKFNIPFNIPTYLGTELDIVSKHLQCFAPLSGDGIITEECENILSKMLGKPCLLVNSATNALEMMALLLDLGPEDEVILPSYTFVSTANAFILRGVKVVFADCDANGNILVEAIEQLITPKTKAICVVHYAGNSCDIDRLLEICEKFKIHLLEDAAQAITSFYKGKQLGTLGTFGCISFHQTKNITCGEGGVLIVNNPNYLERAYIIKQKGTNRRQYINGIVEKYSWVDIGSSYLLSEISAAYLLAQLQQISIVQEKRKKNWQQYNDFFRSNEIFSNGVLEIPKENDPNWHMYALLFKNKVAKLELQNYLKSQGIETATHYLPLHEATFVAKHPEFFVIKGEYNNTLKISDTILRLPLYYNLTEEQLEKIIMSIHNFYFKKNIRSAEVVNELPQTI